VWWQGVSPSPSPPPSPSPSFGAQTLFCFSPDFPSLPFLSSCQVEAKPVGKHVASINDRKIDIYFGKNTENIKNKSSCVKFSITVL